MKRMFGPVMLAVVLLASIPVGAHATAVSWQVPSAVSAATKLSPVTTTHNEVVGSLKRQVLVTQYQTGYVAMNTSNRTLKRVRVLTPSTLRVDKVRVTVYNVVDGREVVWVRDNVPTTGKWLKIGVVCRGECAVMTEVRATTLGRYWDRPHYLNWPGLGV